MQIHKSGTVVLNGHHNDKSIVPNASIFFGLNEKGVSFRDHRPCITRLYTDGDFSCINGLHYKGNELMCLNGKIVFYNLQNSISNLLRLELEHKYYNDF